MPRARTHPGEVLRVEFLMPRHMDERALADAIDLPVKHIREIVRGSQAMTASTASKLARYFQTTPEFWLNLQAAYDLGSEDDEEEEPK
jgi:addiction module HigA family antidote